MKKKLPDTIPKLQPREAAQVVEVALPSKLSPVLYKLKNGTLRASRAIGVAHVSSTLLRSICRLHDIPYAKVVAERDAIRARKIEEGRLADLARAKRIVRASGYTVKKKR